MSDRPGRPLAPVSSTAALRRTNVASVARLLFAEGPMTRAELGRRTGLARPTVQAALGELLEDGTVRELPADVGSGPGRPAATLAVDHRAVSVLACRRRDDVVEAALADLRGHVLTGPLTAPTPPIETLGDTLAALAEALGAGAPEAGPVGSAAVLLPGVVDRSGGRVTVTEPANGWVDVPVVDLVSGALAVPVTVATPAAAALSGIAWQHRHASGSGTCSALLIFLDHGLAASACVDGHTVFGAHGNGGEIGHHLVVQDGAPCRCGRTGCLETLASGWAIAERIAGLRPRVDADGATTLAELEALQRADVDRELDDAATALGAFTAVLVSALEPEQVLLGGTGYAAGARRFLETFRVAVESRRADIGRHRPSFDIAPADADLAGAVRAALGALPSRWRDVIDT